MNFPVRHSPISEFCEERKIPPHIKQAFSAYVTAVLADRFALKSDADTVKIMAGRLGKEQIEEYWVEFIKALAKHLRS